MFIQAIILAILIGYILRGKLANLESVDLKGLYYVIAAFALEFIVVMTIRNGILSKGMLTFCIDLIMYGLLCLFVYINRKNPYVITMGIGFMLNALPIFLNGGAMPVDLEVYKAVGISGELTKEGLYTAINESTKLWFLGDIFPYKFISRLVISIGDIVIAAGLMLLVITGMRKKNIKLN